eukprot:TRINITY_DN30510_c0_g1_i1.p2 TRINITY_DN30510_c0_g1~~TRINITY_DN30510_c0_g1_i1.p2  ORF type:complete len:116 (+),score=6.91 TRINITY_DN30510_c0_g1_i1:1-348(+)
MSSLKRIFRSIRTTRTTVGLQLIQNRIAKNNSASLGGLEATTDGFRDVGKYPSFDLASLWWKPRHGRCFRTFFRNAFVFPVSPLSCFRYAARHYPCDAYACQLELKKQRRKSSNK